MAGSRGELRGALLPFLRGIRKPSKLHYNGLMGEPREIVKVYRKVNLREQPTDFAYWQSQPPVARLEALEAIRCEYHGWTDETHPKVERVYRIVKL